MKTSQKEIGNRIKEQRKLLHITQEQLAERLGVSVKHYGGVERGTARLSVENYVALSDILHVSLDYLLKGTTDSDALIPKRLKEIYFSSSLEKQKHILEILEIINKL